MDVILSQRGLGSTSAVLFQLQMTENLTQAGLGTKERRWWTLLAPGTEESRDGPASGILGPGVRRIHLGFASQTGSCSISPQGRNHIISSPTPTEREHLPPHPCLPERCKGPQENPVSRAWILGSPDPCGRKRKEKNSVSL